MSGPSIMETQTQPQQLSDTGIADDPAASLRAAALKTMKAKRRKGPEMTDIPPNFPMRPAAGTPSIQLDYGSEDQSGTSTTAPAAIPAPAPVASVQPSPSPAPAPMDVDEDEAREEGEISDSETMPPPKSPQVPRQPSRTPSRSAPVRSPTKDRSIPSPIVASTSYSNISVKIEPSPQHLPDASPSISHELYSVDEDHARPGLALTEAQYKRAKEVMLDLLGWGVPPEYLLDCGVSREMIYYSFIEMNLRLPDNFDTTGLPPPLPHAFSSPEPITPPAHSSRPRGASSARRSVGDLHPSLPQKPTAPQGVPANDTTPLSASATPFIPSTTLSAVPMQSEDSRPSLEDMEQQRRQELLARKAVLASRRKQVANASTTLATAPRPEKNTTAIVPEAVDDFLKSIGPANSDPAGPDQNAISNSEDPMDVDDQIPGLSLAAPPPVMSRLSETRSPSTESISPNSLAFPPPPESDGSVRSSSAERSSVPAERSDSSGDNTPRPSSVGPRRVAKRPVASDFVDMDLTSARTQSHHHHHHLHNHHPYARKKPTSFAGLTAHARRMVIDLSDSEEEEGEDIQSKRQPSQQPSRPPTRLGLSASLPTVGTPSPSGLSTPTALLEKEQEIKKMRELIARRERARLDKLTATSGRSTPTGAANDGSTSQSPVVVKQEVIEIRVDASLLPPSAHESIGSHTEAYLPAPHSASDSGLTTPIDTLEHPITGDKVLTAEAYQEEIPRTSSPVDNLSHMEGDMLQLRVDAAHSDMETPSAQASNPSQSNGFAAYHSPLLSYPLLRSRSPPLVFDADSLVEPSSSSQPSDLSTLSSIPISSLKAAAVNRWLSDPSRRICQYEVPGGGECRDPDCEDIHPSRAGTVEPSDNETARGLFAALPKGSAVTLKQLETALQDFRRQSLGYEVRVKQAVASLGLRMAS